MFYYTGVGSRKTPPTILVVMRFIALRLSNADTDWVLRSGGAGGADSAFESGATQADIFIPWPGFRGHPSLYCYPSPEAFMLAAQTLGPEHWSRCNPSARKLHARNCHQILGAGLNEPSSMLICWTKNGLLVGGTGTAIKLANTHNIPVFNLATLLPIEVMRYANSLNG